MAQWSRLCNVVGGTARGLDRGDIPEGPSDSVPLAVACLEFAQTLDNAAQTELAGALQRPVRVVRAQLHGAVDVRRFSNSLAYGLVRLVDDRELDAPDDLVARDRTLGRALPCEAGWSASLVRIKALTGLSSQVTAIDECLLDRRWREPNGFVEAAPDRRCDGKIDVDADEVHQLERTHGIAGRSDRAIDLLDARLLCLEHAQGLKREGPIDPIDDEPRRIPTNNGLLTKVAGELRRPADRVRRSPISDDDFDQRHHRCGVEEVKSHDAFLVPARVADVGDAQRAGVRREHLWLWHS